MPQFQHTLAGQKVSVPWEGTVVIPQYVGRRGARACDVRCYDVWSGSHPNSPGLGDGGLLKFVVLLDTIAKNISYSSLAIVAF